MHAEVEKLPDRPNFILLIVPKLKQLFGSCMRDVTRIERLWQLTWLDSPYETQVTNFDLTVWNILVACLQLAYWQTHACQTFPREIEHNIVRL